MDEKLYEGLRIKVWKMYCRSGGENKEYAGGYSIEVIEIFSVKLEMKLGLGQPFDCAYKEAERLAVLVDAELTLDGEIVRKSFRGIYK